MFKKKKLLIISFLTLIILSFVFLALIANYSNENHQALIKTDLNNNTITEINNKKVNSVIDKPVKVISCDKKALDYDLNSLIKRLAIDVKKYNFKKNKETSLVELYEIISESNSKNNLSLQKNDTKIPEDQLVNITYNQNIDKSFVTSIINDQLEDSLYIIANKKEKKIIGYISEAASFKKDLPFDYLAKLKNYTSEVTINDAISLTKNGYSDEILTLILNEHSFNFNPTWYDGIVIKNLPLVAIDNSNLEALKYWLEKGLQINNEDIDISPLRRIPPPKNKIEYKKNKYIAELIAQNTYKITFEEYQTLKMWMNKSDLESFMNSYGHITNFSVQSNNQKDLKVYSIVNKYKKKILNLKSQYFGCFINKDINDDYNQYIKRFFEIDENILHESIFEKRASNPLLISKKLIANKLLLLLSVKKWDEALLLAENEFITENDASALNLLLEFLLVNHASQNLVIKTIESGATFDDNAVFNLILHGKLEDIKAYKEIGLNISYRNHDGFNALHFAIVYKSNLEMINYLYEDGVPFVKDNRGYTPLDYLLKNIDHTNKMREIFNYFKSLDFNQNRE